MKYNKKKFLLSTPAAFHYPNLAEIIQKKNQLTKIVSGYPLFKLKNYAIDNNKINSYGFYQLILNFLFKLKIKNETLINYLILRNLKQIDKIAARYVNYSDVYLALSGTGLETGRLFKKKNKMYICERSSSHILFAKEILTKEFKKYQIKFNVDKKIIQRELAEYKIADFILVPSLFAKKTFKDRGFKNVKVISFPSDKKIFYNKGIRNFYDKKFRIVFVGGLTLRKGIPYLLDAFSKLKLKNSELHLIGSQSVETNLFRDKLLNKNIFLHGHKKHREINDFLNKCHIFVMPSLEEGAAISVAQAMNTGLPVIVTENTGWKEIVNKNNNGFVVKPMNSNQIFTKLKYLDKNRKLLENFSKNSLKYSKNKSWRNYFEELNQLVANY